jgi:hypothetical protein
MSLESVCAFLVEKAPDIDPLRMAELIYAEWVDVCQGNSEDMS